MGGTGYRNPKNIRPAMTGNTPATCATIGFFDGVHRGHQFVIGRLRDLAREAGLQSAVITFDRHPRQVVHPDYVPQLITPTPEKLRLLARTGADRVEVLAFDTAMSQLTAREFMRRVLLGRFGVRRLLIGYDNRFGHNRAEGFAEYAAYGREMGIEVIENTPVDVDGMRVSSSLVRRLIAGGDVAEAARCLGRAFCMEGCVEHGFQEGRQLGFPTANIAPACSEQIVPKTGVYAVRASIGGGPWLPAMMNVGTNPTFGRDRLTLEAHIIGFDGDIYGRTVRTEYVCRMRDERRFDSIEQLRCQLATDREEAARILGGTREEKQANP